MSTNNDPARHTFDKGNVLVVDDNPANLRLLNNILSKHGYKVRPATSGKLAIRSARRKLPDIVLLDIRMPEMDGYEVCRILKSSPDTAGLPIIFISALSEEENKVKAFQAGGVDYLTKPFSETEVLARIETHLNLYRMQQHLEELVDTRTRELQAAYEMVSRSEAKYRGLFDDALDMIHVVDKNWMIIDANPVELKTLGYTREEYFGKPLLEIIHPAYREKTEGILRRALAGREIKNYETVLIGKTGQTIEVEVNSVPLVKNGECVAARSIIRDITARKKAQAALRKSHGLYKESQKIAKMGHWELDLVTNHLAWSDEIYRIYEVTREKFGASYEAFLGLVHPADREFVNKAYTDSLKERTKYDIVHRLLFSDGREKYVHSKCRTDYDEQGRPIRSLGTVQDITELTMAEERLRLTQFSIDNVKDCIFWMDVEARFNFVNDAACRRLGYSRDELLAMRLFDIDLNYPPEQWPEQWQRLMKVGSSTIETTHRAKSGEEFPVEVTGTMVEYKGKQYNCAIARDITERKRAEQQIRKSKEEWERSFEAIGDIATIQDLQQRIIRVNRKACETFGAHPEELKGKLCYEVFRGGDTPCAGCPVAMSIKDFEVHTAEIQHKQLGKTFVVSASPICDAEGNISGIVHFARDITERKTLEGQLRQAQKMEAIGTLAGGIAHDFNNILTPILGYAEITLDSIAPASPIYDDLKEVVKAAHRARELVKQILTFSRQAEQALQPLKIQFVVKEALKLIRASIPTTIEIKQNIDQNCGAVLADPTQIHQVIMNLCTNAYHAMRETGGVLGVKLSEVELDHVDLQDKLELQAEASVMLEISDTGHGMTREVQDKIFDPYFTTKAKGEGTGLGLSVVHGIVKSLGGDITVYSEPGVGTSFHVYLPAIKAVAKEYREEKPGLLPTGGERILVVDDEKAIVDLERQLIESLGYRVTAFTDCEQALKAFHSDPDGFDLIITDMTMPKITGFELAKEVFSVRADMPIILCTGFSELISEKKAKAIGIREFILKPVVKKDLAIIIRKVLDGVGVGVVAAS